MRWRRILNPEILIVDEVLAVGDAANFSKNASAKWRMWPIAGARCLFVSHNMQAINLLCMRGVYLEHGNVGYVGSAREAIEHYTRASRSRTGGFGCRGRPGSGEYRFAWVKPSQAIFDPGEKVRVDFSIQRFKGHIGRHVCFGARGG